MYLNLEDLNFTNSRGHSVTAYILHLWDCHFHEVTVWQHIYCTCGTSLSRGHCVTAYILHVWDVTFTRSLCDSIYIAHVGRHFHEVTVWQHIYCTCGTSLSRGHCVTAYILHVWDVTFTRSLCDSIYIAHVGRHFHEVTVWQHIYCTCGTSLSRGHCVTAYILHMWDVTFTRSLCDSIYIAHVGRHFHEVTVWQHIYCTCGTSLSRGHCVTAYILHMWDVTFTRSLMTAYILHVWDVTFTRSLCDSIYIAHVGRHFHEVTVWQHIYCTCGTSLSRGHCVTAYILHMWDVTFTRSLCDSIYIARVGRHFHEVTVWQHIYCTCGTSLSRGHCVTAYILHMWDVTFTRSLCDSIYIAHVGRHFHEVTVWQHIYCTCGTSLSRGHCVTAYILHMWDVTFTRSLCDSIYIAHVGRHFHEVTVWQHIYCTCGTSLSRGHWWQHIYCTCGTSLSRGHCVTAYILHMWDVTFTRSLCDSIYIAHVGRHFHEVTVWQHIYCTCGTSLSRGHCVTAYILHMWDVTFTRSLCDSIYIAHVGRHFHEVTVWQHIYCTCGTSLSRGHCVTAYILHMWDVTFTRSLCDSIYIAHVGRHFHEVTVWQHIYCTCGTSLSRGHCVTAYILHVWDVTFTRSLCDSIYIAHVGRHFHEVTVWQHIYCTCGTSLSRGHCVTAYILHMWDVTFTRSLCDSIYIAHVGRHFHEVTVWQHIYCTCGTSLSWGHCVTAYILHMWDVTFTRSLMTAYILHVWDVTFTRSLCDSIYIAHVGRHFHEVTVWQHIYCTCGTSLSRGHCVTAYILHMWDVTFMRSLCDSIYIAHVGRHFHEVTVWQHIYCTCETSLSRGHCVTAYILHMWDVTFTRSLCDSIYIAHVGRHFHEVTVWQHIYCTCGTSLSRGHCVTAYILHMWDCHFHEVTVWQHIYCTCGTSLSRGHCVTAYILHMWDVTFTRSLCDSIYIAHVGRHFHEVTVWQHIYCTCGTSLSRGHCVTAYILHMWDVTFTRSLCDSIYIAHVGRHFHEVTVWQHIYCTCGMSLSRGHCMTAYILHMWDCHFHEVTVWQHIYCTCGTSLSRGHCVTAYILHMWDVTFTRSLCDSIYIARVGRHFHEVTVWQHIYCTCGTWLSRGHWWQHIYCTCGTSLSRGHCVTAYILHMWDVTFTRSLCDSIYIARVGRHFHEVTVWQHIYCTCGTSLSRGHCVTAYILHVWDVTFTRSLCDSIYIARVGRHFLEVTVWQHIYCTCGTSLSRGHWWQHIYCTCGTSLSRGHCVTAYILHMWDVTFTRSLCDSIYIARVGRHFHEVTVWQHIYCTCGTSLGLTNLTAISTNWCKLGPKKMNHNMCWIFQFAHA